VGRREGSGRRRRRRREGSGRVEGEERGQREGGG
jgi:hypothetical protein